jgi:LPS sulfotransferase NodH
MTKKSHIDLFTSLATDPDSEVPATKTLLLLATPRCGSTLFTEILNSTRELGYCDEWLNHDYFNAWSEVMGQEFDLDTYLDFVRRKTTRGTGVFCLKWHASQIMEMSQTIGMELGHLDFALCVYLFRRDLVAQAVSLAKAVKTGQYRSYEETNVTDFEIGMKDVVRELSAIITMDQFVADVLYEAVDHEFAYEDYRAAGVAGDCGAARVPFDTILEAFDKPLHDLTDFEPISLKKQADEQSEEACRNFRRYIGGPR